MLVFGCTWGPAEVRGQKSFVEFAKKEICRDVALSKTTTAHEEEAPVESACSQMLAVLAAAMEKGEKAERLENERNASDLQSRTPEPGTPPIQQEQLQTSDQGDPAQQFPDQTPGHASLGEVQLLPIQITTQEGRHQVMEVTMVMLIRKTMKKKRPQIQSGLLTATSGCPATSATESSSFWETCTPTRTRIIKICSCHYQKERKSMIDQRMH